MSTRGAGVQYLLLIYDEESAGPQPGTAEYGAMWSEYQHFTTTIRERGEFVAGGALRPTTAATTIQVQEDVTLASDGPFETTDRQLIGYYLIDVADLDEAIATASRLPGARHGCVEVRPVMEVP